MTTATLSHASALARLGYALSDGTRARVLLELRHGPAYPSELAEQLGVSRQVMSNQLTCLRGCGLVEATAEGRRNRYRLTSDRLAAGLAELLELTLHVEPTCCAGEAGCRCG